MEGHGRLHFRILATGLVGGFSSALKLPASLIGAVWVGFCLVSAPVSAMPESVVKRFEAGLIELMKARAGLDFDGRYAQLAPLVSETFDIPYMGRLVLSRHWSSLPAADRVRFTAAFEKLVISAFASEVGEFDGEVFKFDQVKPLKRGRMLVRSRLIEPDGDVDRFDYVVRMRADGTNSSGEDWVIVNLVVGGVSDLALKRSEYGGVMSSGGLDALLQRIEAQIAVYRRAR